MGATGIARADARMLSGRFLHCAIAPSKGLQRRD